MTTRQSDDFTASRGIPLNGHRYRFNKSNIMTRMDLRHMSSSDFATAYGFRRDEVRLDNWREAPWNVWAFSNVSEFVPTARIAAVGTRDETAVDPGGLLAETVNIGGDRRRIAELLAESSTDALVVMKSGRFIADFYAPHFSIQSRHIIFSISKTLTAILVGIAQDHGLLDAEAPVTTYMPELAGSAYGDTSVRNLLDMRVSLAFQTNNHGPSGDFARYRRATLWHPADPGYPTGTLLDFIASLAKGEEEHGDAFRYRSSNSDLLGIILERVSGGRFADLASRWLWQPTGARQDGYVTVDAAGTARAAAGVVTAARDLVRVGEMMRLGGVAGGRRVVSGNWVHDTLAGGDADAWKRGDFAHMLEHGRYRNKWYQTGHASGAFFTFGIHGQWLYVNPSAEVVVVKMSSQPVPVDAELDQLCLQLFDGITAVA